MHARWRRRMLMARIEAGYGERIDDLADRLRELGHVKGWSAETLGAMQRGYHSNRDPRPIQPQEITVLAEACGVSPAFFDIDLAKLAPPDVHAELATLKAQIADLQDGALRAVQAIEELRGKGRPEAPPGDP